MPRVNTVLLLLVMLTALGGCASGPLSGISRAFHSEGEPYLNTGIKLYEDGRYPQAAKSFEQALNAGLKEADQVTAHKYLAFIHCVARRERQCRGHFSTALEIDPSFELQPSEAGHPMWGPVFRSVKTRRR